MPKEADTPPSGPPANTQCLGYNLVGDNTDKGVKARYMRVEGSHNKSLHYFHSFAVLNRVDLSHLPDAFPHICLNHPRQLALALLPSKDDDRALTLLFGIHGSRILCTHIHVPFFKFVFEDVAQWHIHHWYYDQMSGKSEVVSATKQIQENHPRKLVICYLYRYHLGFYSKMRTRQMTWSKLCLTSTSMYMYQQQNTQRLSLSIHWRNGPSKACHLQQDTCICRGRTAYCSQS